jgi:hypothetical protein
MSSLEMLQCLRDLRDDGIIRNFAVYGAFPVSDSADRRIHPVDVKRDEQPYDPQRHPPKPSVTFSVDVFRELRAVATIEGDPDDIARRFGVHKTLYKV